MARKSKSADKKIRVLLVEDQDITAKLFETFLLSSGRYEVAGHLKNADLAPAFCSRGGVELILMDVYTELGASGIEAASLIKKDHPDIKIVIITSLPEVSYIRRAKEGGIDSFWYKEAGEEALLEICDRTMQGEQVYPDDSPELPLGLITSKELTARELDILREVARGSTNQEIAEHLYLSVNTVRDYIKIMMSKTGFHTRTEMAIRAREVGLVIPE
ncbi:MAG: response regulator transcription factor [Lachnospiraceae bacterium]|nr:response regulator transcription factor [Lachnospiraceae bacterium]